MADHPEQPDGKKRAIVVQVVGGEAKVAVPMPTAPQPIAAAWMQGSNLPGGGGPTATAEDGFTPVKHSRWPKPDGSTPVKTPSVVPASVGTSSSSSSSGSKPQVRDRPFAEVMAESRKRSEAHGGTAPVTPRRSTAVPEDDPEL